MKIAIAICTYRRPDSLSQLLNAIVELQLPATAPVFTHDQLHVIVVDNDTEAAGISAAQSLADSLPYHLHTALATAPGLSAARNKAVTVALQCEPDLVAFLDDDEWPDPQWLAELVRVQIAHDSDAVGGPTRSVFPPEATPEQRENSYYGADLATDDGAEVELQAGGNFLMRASTLQSMGDEPFDPQFAQSGGEDLAFFTTLARRGARMHWAANASVNEHVPADRLAPGWMKQRVVNIANSRVRVMQQIDTGLGARLVRVVKTLGLGVVTGVVSVLGLASPALAERARLMRWKFWGKLSAHLGLQTIRQEIY